MNKETKLKAAGAISAKGSKTKQLLLDAAETLMRDSGYAAVTTRSVSELAGVNLGLFHYYVGTVDELFVALFKRMTDDLYLRQEQIAESDNPLRVFWNISSDTSKVRLWNEFLALANHRDSVRAEVAEFGERWRNNQIAILSKVKKRDSVRTISISLEGLAVFLESIARNIGIEKSIGISAGHDQALNSIFDMLDQLDPPDQNEISRLAEDDD